MRCQCPHTLWKNISDIQRFAVLYDLEHVNDYLWELIIAGVPAFRCSNDFWDRVGIRACLEPVNYL